MGPLITITTFMTNFFIDTSFLIALLFSRDRMHLRAKNFLANQTNFQGVVSNLILNELLTYFSRHANLKTALEFQSKLLQDPAFEVIWVGKEFHVAGSKILQKYQEHHISFVDAVSFAIMKQNKIHKALSFDRDFVRAGVECLP